MRISQYLKDDPSQLSKEIGELSLQISKLGLIQSRYDMVIFKNINLEKKVKEKMEKIGDLGDKPAEEQLPDPSAMEDKIKKVEEELSMSKEDLKKKLEA